ncbi:MAG: TonB-dependent receptor [Spongiibacteraceae bacterium]
MTNNRIQKRAFAISALALAIAAPLPVLAQGQLEEIIVSARKTDEGLQSVPIAVSAFNAESLAQMNVAQTSDLGKFTPSVYIEPPAAGNSTAAKVTIRGQNQSDSLITLDPSVGWYLDDVYLARTYGTVASMFDIERVEVLKGPQGTLYGRNTTGGAVKLVTTKAEPSADLNGYVTGGVGNLDAWKVGGAVNIPLIPDVLAIRIAALKDTANGYGDVNVYSYQIPSSAAPAFLAKKDAGFRDTEMYRLNLTWYAADNIDVQFGYEHSKLDMSTLQRNIRAPYDSYATAGIPATTDFYESNLTVPPRSMAENDTVNLTVNYDITDTLATKLIYGWRRVDSQYFSDIDGAPDSFNNPTAPSPQWARQQSLEWQISGVAAQEMLEWMTGIYLFEEDGRDETVSYGAASGYTVNHIYGRAENESRSIFANGTLHLTDKLNFNGGMRYSYDDKPLYKRLYATSATTGAFVTCRLDPATPGYDANDCSSTAHGNYDYVSWQAGFDYTIADDMMVYIKSSNAKRSGGQNVRGLTAATSQPFEPEEATDIELGFKSQLFDNRLRVNADVFHTFYENIQQSIIFQIPGIGTGTQVVNQAKADLDGVEFEVTGLITDNFTATLTGSLLNWKFEDDTSILPSAPGQQYSLRLDYDLPVSVGTVNFSANYSWRDELLANPAGGRAAIRSTSELTTDELGLLSSRVALNMEDLGLTVAVWGNNLTDEEYTTSPLQLGTRVGATIGEPRTYGLDVTKKF